MKLIGTPACRAPSSPSKPSRQQLIATRWTLDKLIGYLGTNLVRMDYRLYRALGFQIGSGAMESLHRTASQARLQVPGARWLEETSQPILNLRMLDIVGRWDEFWSQPDLTHQLATAFVATHTQPSETMAEAA